jgi:cardiolipin synthase
MLTKLPNLLTFARIALIPALVGAFYVDGPFSNWATLLIFVSAGITDYFDGYFARSLGQVSSLGRFLDPVADKLLVAAAILMLVALDRVTGITVLAAVVILCREILVSGLREFLAEIRVSLPVSNLAKWKTVLQMVAISFLLIGSAAPFNLPATEIGAYGLWIAALLTLYTGYDYLRAGLRYVRGADQAETSPKPTAPAKSTSQAG